MSGKPWFKFYGSDWRADPALRRCSFGARGLWIDLLSLMHEGQPYGELRIAGTALSAKDIARLLGASEGDVKRLLSELETAKVFSRTDDGAIYSRRMRRDHARAEEGRRAIGKRWGTDDAPADRSPNTATPIGNLLGQMGGKPITQKPEALSKKEAAGRSVPRNAAPGMWKRWATKWETDSNGDPDQRQPIRAGWQFNVAADLVCEAARIEDEGWLGDWDTIAEWLDAGIDLQDSILPAIRRVAGRQNYQPPKTLRYFDPAVREQRRAA